MRKRIDNMNKCVNKLRNLPFSYYDKFYGMTTGYMEAIETDNLLFNIIIIKIFH